MRNVCVTPVGGYAARERRSVRAGLSSLLGRSVSCRIRKRMPTIRCPWRRIPASRRLCKSRPPRMVMPTARRGVLSLPTTLQRMMSISHWLVLIATSDPQSSVAGVVRYRRGSATYPHAVGRVHTGVFQLVDVTVSVIIASEHPIRAMFAVRGYLCR